MLIASLVSLVAKIMKTMGIQVLDIDDIRYSITQEDNGYICTSTIGSQQLSITMKINYNFFLNIYSGRKLEFYNTLII